MLRLVVIAAILTMPVANAGESAFSTGPAIEEFGPAANVIIDFEVPDGVPLRLSFDVSTQSQPGEPNKTLVAAARFLNMHARAGIEDERVQLAVVVHGKAVFDVSRGTRSEEERGNATVNERLVAALVAGGVKIVVCGQSAVYYDVDNDALLPGVRMALSAMTAHAVLQHQGYSLNPF